MNIPRGLKNANPGNIRKSTDLWRGLAVEQPDPDFFTFREPLWGLRALAVILLNYERKYRLDTVDQIINRWAPENENNTGAYCSHVANCLGVNLKQRLDLSDPSTLGKLVKAIVLHENGQCPYDDALIEQAVKLALTPQKV